MLVADESPLPAGERAPGPGRRGWRRAGTIAGLVGLGSAALAFGARIPYYAIAPGEVLATPDLVKVVDGPSYQPKGSVSLVTVFQAHVTPFDAVRGWLDPDVDVYRQKEIIPPHTSPKQVQKANLQMMATSKESALGVAFEKLGYDAIKGDGAELAQIVKGSPADRAGLKVGDLITAVGPTPVQIHIDAVHALGSRKPGDTVTLTVVSKATGQPRQVSAVLAAQAHDKSKPLLGVVLRTKNLHFDFPYDVKVASEQIGGPSAGLAYTLEVLDVLTPGEITGGRAVAATGTIELDGSVGEIGGIVQKTAAVSSAGIKLFLVPRGEYEQAKAHARHGLRVEPVDNLDDALRALATVGGNGLALGHLKPPSGS
ncbi:MAG: PDZ domain-containing protein [Acidobacteria bacterium]|nr:PDZ domain-containing protein [Acidobacteriota bacterium]